MKLSSRNSSCQQCVNDFRPNFGLNISETTETRGIKFTRVLKLYISKISRGYDEKLRVI